MSADKLEALIEPQPPEDDDPDWDELTARAARMMPEPGRETLLESVERVLGKTGV